MITVPRLLKFQELEAVYIIAFTTVEDSLELLSGLWATTRDTFKPRIDQGGALICL